MSDMEGRSFINDLKRFDGEALFDLGHPCLNRIVESFVKASGIGAVHAVSHEAYNIAAEGFEPNSNLGFPQKKKQNRISDLEGASYGKSLETVVKRAGKEAMHWGLAAGVYSGVTYGMEEARGGVRDWKNAAVAGALTGVTLAMVQENSTHDQIVSTAITGAALSTAASILNKVV